MKTAIAVWMAAARQIVWKLILIAAALAAVEIGLFYRVAGRMAAAIRVDGYVSDSFGVWLDRARGYEVFVVAFALVTAVLMLQGCDYHGGKLRYTLQRLPLSETAVTLLWAALHIVCYLILWAVQLAVVAVCWRMYTQTAYGGNGQLLELFVECYLDDFLHGLLPLEHVAVWLRQSLWILCMGTGTAWFGMQQRRGKHAFGTTFALLVGLWTFGGDVRTASDMAGLMAVLFGMMAVYFIGRIWRRAYEKED